MRRKHKNGKVGGPAPNYAVRNLLRNFKERNEAEQKPTSMRDLERQIRAQVQQELPNLTPAEVEARVTRRMMHGMRRS